ncbi:P-loop NTPase fold protein [Yoonia sp. R2-816]|uniref:KAP family P-loop NTPase fold protein n=1 Tax=Yoonia sp. R2-816 TaxID=3342638 RepID=UPI00372B932E
MSGKRFDLSIKPEDTFETADLLGRKDLAESMLALVETSVDPLVVALDDDWGAGKTYFLKLWQKMLISEGLPVIYFNAFENDFSRDAFVSLSASLAEALNLNDNSSTRHKHTFLLKAAKFGKIVSRSLVNVAIRAGTAGAVDIADAGEAVDAALTQIGDETTQRFHDLIDEKSNFREELHAFKAALVEVRLALQADDNDFPLVFIIDELDRCRPDFALDLLECLKHFFELEKTHFVLGVNLEVLEKSVTSVYGGDLEGNGYLSRFIDYRLSFSPARHSSKRQDLVTYARHLWKRAEALELHNDVSEGLIEIVASGVEKKRWKFSRYE